MGEALKGTGEYCPAKASFRAMSNASMRSSPCSPTDIAQTRPTSLYGTENEVMASTASPRICSLLPSATEIAFALGLDQNLVGVTHECDYPAAARSITSVTSSLNDTETLTSADIDAAVRRSLENLSTLYLLDRDGLRAAQPDLILTQELCDVCAVSFDTVQAVAREICPNAEIVSLEPTSVDDILQDILKVAMKAGAVARGEELVHELRARIERIRSVASDVSYQPRVVALEWLDPPFIAGHWVPELIRLAGGQDALGQEAVPSRRQHWRDILASEPEVTVVMPCGFDLNRTLEEYARTRLPDEWNGGVSACPSRVYCVDGSAYFSRPGPRVVDGLEILATILHPERFGDPDPRLARLISRSASRRSTAPSQGTR